MVKALFIYPFEQLKVDRITCRIRSGNTKAIRLAEELGFTLEGRLRQMLQGKDQLIFGMLKHECRYL